MLCYHAYKGMGGTLNQAAFNRYETRATAAVSRYTFGRASMLSPPPLELESLLFDLIELYQREAVKDVASVSNDGVAVSYNTGITDEQAGAQEARMIYGYLEQLAAPDGTPLLYCGVQHDA